ncbi:MAG: N-acylneuraminate-9-phosphate synthase [Rhodospirillales bacterium]|nr:MAG: N-acylneuraminate-9-phosphate synthase [Rhodospirillales bacterium]
MKESRPVQAVRLGDKLVGPGQPCYVIAEIGGNFETLEDGRRLIDLAMQCGCDAVKLQTFRADTITSRKAMFNMENTGIASQWEHFRKYELSKEIHAKLFDCARQKGLFFFSTPSHESDVDLLEEIGVGAHKIGSDDAANPQFLRYAARTGKPVLLSTGMCTLDEVKDAVSAIEETGNRQLILFHCTTNYPTHLESVNLRAMQTMQETFDYPVGYSDHTLGIDVCYAAAVLGAPILEFHFTSDKQGSGPDHMLSKDPLETALLVKKLKDLPVLLGDGIKRPASSEAETRRNNRKSLVLTADFPKGSLLTREGVAVKRPGYGIAPADLEKVIERKAARDLKAEDILAWDDLA